MFRNVGFFFPSPALDASDYPDDRDPDERPSAAKLRNHQYLIRPPGWVFSDFSGGQKIARDDSDDNWDEDRW
jgi:hypothetical protein